MSTKAIAVQIQQSGLGAPIRVFTDRELATVLHALRVQQGGCPNNECDHFSDDHVSSLNADEIDALCERLNLAPSRKVKACDPEPMTIWTVTTDTDCGLDTRAYRTEREAHAHLIDGFLIGKESHADAMSLLEAGHYRHIVYLVLDETMGGYDAFRIDSHTI